MRSKANIKGHPVHPMLIAFPIGFTVAAPAFDLAGLLGEWPTAWSAGAYLSVAAVASGLIAAVPGLIDFLYVIPPRSSARQRAIYHMIVNVLALALVASSAVLRDWDNLRPEPLAVVLEAAGVGLMSIGGWLGGTLAYRNQIGVDHRYAHAGKWHEETVAGKPGETVAIPGATDLKAGQMMLLHVGDDRRRIVFARTDDGYAAFDDHCTHRGGPLADGVLACGTVTCPWHGSQFNVSDGAVEARPAEKSIQVHRVETAAGEVRLIIPDRM